VARDLGWGDEALSKRAPEMERISAAICKHLGFDPAKLTPVQVSPSFPLGRPPSRGRSLPSRAGEAPVPRHENPRAGRPLTTCVPDSSPDTSTYNSRIPPKRDDAAPEVPPLGLAGSGLRLTVFKKARSLPT